MATLNSTTINGKLTVSGSAYVDGRQVISGVQTASGANIGAVGTPTVTASTSGGTTTLTFDYLKGAKGDKGDKGDTGATGPTGPAGSVASVTTTGSGNAVTSVTMDATTKAVTATKGATFATASHTHTKSQITDFPASLKNPYTLKLKNTGGSVIEYDGSSAKDLSEGVYYSAYTGSIAYKNIRSSDSDAYDYHGTIGTLDPFWDQGFSGNRLAFLDPDTVTIEYSQDSGATWTDSGYGEVDKRCIFADQFGDVRIRVGVSPSGSMPTSMSAAKALQTRLTITNPTDRYCTINRMSLWFSGAHTCYVQVQYALWETPDTFAVWRDWTRVSGWSGPNIMSLTSRPCFGYSNQVYKIRLVFAVDSLDTSYPTNIDTFGNIRFYGNNAWSGGSMHTFPYHWDYKGDIVPNTDHKNSTQNLGTTGNQWTEIHGKRIYADGAIYFRESESSGATYPRIMPGDGSYMSIVTSGGNTFVFNAAGNISYSLLRPSSNNVYSLGTSSYEWSNVYAKYYNIDATNGTDAGVKFSNGLLLNANNNNGFIFQNTSSNFMASIYDNIMYVDKDLVSLNNGGLGSAAYKWTAANIVQGNFEKIIAMPSSEKTSGSENGLFYIDSPNNDNGEFIVRSGYVSTDTAWEGFIKLNKVNTPGDTETTIRLTATGVEGEETAAYWPTTTGTILTTDSVATHTQKGPVLLGNSSTLTTPTTGTATSGTSIKNYYVGVDNTGKLCVYVPWTHYEPLFGNLTKASSSLPTSSTINGYYFYPTSGVNTSNTCAVRYTIIRDSNNAAQCLELQFYYYASGSSSSFRVWATGLINSSSISQACTYGYAHCVPASGYGVTSSISYASTTVSSKTVNYLTITFTKSNTTAGYVRAYAKLPLY